MAASNKILIETPNNNDVRLNHISWDEYFMSIAILSALRSKDPHTKVGAAIVSPDHKVASLGYNGMPRGIEDTKISWGRTGDELDTKYPYVCHAELNAVLNATTRDLEGDTVYVTLFPCNECAKALIQVGIKRVIFLDDKYHDSTISIAARKLFSMAGVDMVRYTGRIPQIDFGDIKYVQRED